MKIVNKFLERVGTDRLIHFLVGAVIVALLYPFDLTLLGIGVVWLASCAKELIDSFEPDNRCDWLDVLAGVLGAVVMCIYYCVV